MNSSKTLVLAAIASSGLVAAEADAVTLIYEPFDYAPAGARVSTYTQSGQGLSGNWADSGTLVESGGLSYGDLTVTGNRVTLSDDSARASTGLTLTNPGNPTDTYLDDGDVLWFSVLVNPGVIDTNSDIGFALGTNGLEDRDQVPMSSGGSGLGFRIKNGLRAVAWDANGATGRINPTSSAAVSGLTVGTTSLILGRLTFGATDTVDLWLPGMDLSFDINTPLVSLNSTVDQTVFDTVTFADKTASTRDQFDEIRFGTEFSDVLVPEPGSLALVGLGGLLVARRRRD